MKLQLRKIFFIFILGIFAGFLTSCQSLPVGNPPEGAIVNIEDTGLQPLTERAAINQMVTALATSQQLETNSSKKVANILPPSIIAPEDYRVPLTSLSVRVYTDLINMGMLKTDITEHPNYILSSKFLKNPILSEKFKGKCVFNWEMSLTIKGENNPQWSYSIKVIIPHSP